MAAALSCLSLSATLAQPVVPSESVVITATRVPQPASRVLADVSVLERDAIERSGATCIADLLARLPGVEFGRSGGPAGTTGVFIRGAESRHTAVYIDGLRVDAQGTGGAPWELLPVDQIERIEVLRGAAATVYGSDAVAGVVQLFTRRAGSRTQTSANLSAGSYGTLQGRAAVSGAAGALDYALSASHGRSDGYNARLTATSNPDADGWRRSGLQGSLGLDVATGHRVEAALLASNLWGQYDAGRTTDDVSRQNLRTAGLSWQAHWSPEADTRLQLGESQNTYESQPSFYRTETTLRNYLLQHNQRWGHQQLSLTLERREDKLFNPATAYVGALAGERSQDALALSWRGDFGQHSLQLQLRHDHDSEFGDKPTGSLAWGWQFLPSWRAMASVATSFRAPTLYQRFSEYGVATLSPENGRNQELALRWSEGDSELSATAWHNRVKDLIAFGSAGPCASTFGCYENVGRVRYEGLTLAGHTRVAGVALHGSADWHDPRNLVTDKLLQRRARVLGTLGVDGQWQGWGLGLELQGAGGRYENTANTQRMGGYGLVNLRAERALVPGLALQARVDNLADKAYEVARTYATAGRTVTLGLRWAM
jgi:vitamin B12 transporter